MKTPSCLAAALCLAFSVIAFSLSAQTQQGTQFTYQGSLKNGAVVANGQHDFEFSLFDSLLGGTQSGSTITKEDVLVTDGLFVVELDFGPAVFFGDERYLQIGVRPGNDLGAFTILSPRQLLTATPYALTLAPGASIKNKNSNALNVSTEADSGAAIHAQVFNNASNSAAVFAETDGAFGAALSAYAGSASGTNYGLYTKTNSNAGKGVYSESPYIGIESKGTSPDGFTIGVRGIVNSTSPSAIGVLGKSEAATGESVGVKGESSSVSGKAVHGYAMATAGTNYGVYGETNSDDGYGVFSKGNMKVEGDVHIDGELTWNYKFGYASISGAAFKPEKVSAFDNYVNHGDSFEGSSSEDVDYVASIQLPHKASVTQVTFFWHDNSAIVDITCSLNRMAHALPNSGVPMVTLTSSDFPGQGSTSSSTITYPDVNNSQYAYYVKATIPHVTMKVYSVVVEYITLGP